MYTEETLTRKASACHGSSATAIVFSKPEIELLSLVLQIDNQFKLRTATAL